MKRKESTLIGERGFVSEKRKGKGGLLLDAERGKRKYVMELVRRESASRLEERGTGRVFVYFAVNSGNKGNWIVKDVKKKIGVYGGSREECEKMVVGVFRTKVLYGRLRDIEDSIIEKDKVV